MESILRLKLVQSNPGNRYQYYEETVETGDNTITLIELDRVPRWVIKNPTPECAEVVCQLIPGSLVTKNGFNMTQTLLISPEIVRLSNEQQRFCEKVVITCNNYSIEQNVHGGIKFFLFKQSEHELFHHLSFQVEKEKKQAVILGLDKTFGLSIKPSWLKELGHTRTVFPSKNIVVVQVVYHLHLRDNQVQQLMSTMWSSTLQTTDIHFVVNLSGGTSIMFSQLEYLESKVFREQIQKSDLEVLLRCFNRTLGPIDHFLVFLNPIATYVNQPLITVAYE